MADTGHTTGHISEHDFHSDSRPLNPLINMATTVVFRSHVYAYKGVCEARGHPRLK